ncbi:transcription termination factor NusA [Anaeropeptidivorans aminofermentans]|jgi:N utilization substance protein A|uniref:transcription termination factor NusA n=1 Tax=Anaeropeptidivorans aminofermentans TaxID=2934315 RepID=UPI0020249989|nr:transcription termination factor NusA [Anaeropeptidivorans aminofermentans]MBE6011251.1 transcription termination/antitermination protein NusA [Lachnospiraceae bacterium]
MGNNSELIEALNQIVREKGIDADVIFEAIETSLITACKKNFGNNQNVKVKIDRETGDVQCFVQKEAVETVEDSLMEISLENAKEINPVYELGDIVDIIVTPKNFGRIAAQTAKQVVVQKFREAEREILYSEYITKEKDIVTGIIQRKEGKNIIIVLGKVDAMLSANEQIAGEEYRPSQRIKVYVVEVKQTSKGPLINVSRTHPELVKRLFEHEVPEIFEGIVEIKSISREAGSRSKIAVYSNNPDVDAVGACVGQNGYRVNIIVNELNGEKIDIINWSSDPREYIASALSPSKVLAVITDPATQSAKVIVPNHQLSLAIGKEGQNARLAAKLTGWKINIKSEASAKEPGFLTEEEYDMYFNGQYNLDDASYEQDYVQYYENDIEDNDYN